MRDIMEHIETTSVSLVDVHAQPTMRWSAIVGGWLVATGVASLLYVAGLALGFSAFDPYNADATAKSIGMGTAVWMVLTWATALFLGGMFASWFDGRSDQTVGTLHGITVWGLSVAVSGLLLAVGLTQGIQGGSAIVRGAATTGLATAGVTASQVSMRGPASGATDDAIMGLQAQLTQRIAQSTTRGTDQLDRRSMAAVASALLKGHTETAKTLLAANTSMSQAEIDQTLQGMSAQVDKYKADVQAAADAAAHYAATAMWIVFFSTLLALVAAALGGWLGAGHIHRVHHLRRYEVATPR
jgi:hypothetical protein